MMESKDTLTALDYEKINSLNTETLKQILQLVISGKENGNVKSTAHANNCSVSSVNETYVNIVGLFTEAAKYKYDDEKLKSRLNDTGMLKSHVEQFCEAYRICRQKTFSNLQIIGRTLRHVVDVDWQLDYNVKTSTSNSTGVLYYHISLMAMNQSDVKFIKFTCTVQQLQELIHKLKDAVRHIEKLSAG